MKNNLNKILSKIYLKKKKKIIKWFDVINALILKDKFELKIFLFF